MLRRTLNNNCNGPVQKKNPETVTPKTNYPRATAVSPVSARELFKMMKRGEIEIRRELDIDFVDEDGIDA